MRLSEVIVLVEFPNILYRSSNWSKHFRCPHSWRSHAWRSQLSVHFRSLRKGLASFVLQIALVFDYGYTENWVNHYSLCLL